jgi:hypothetical protein
MLLELHRREVFEEYFDQEELKREFFDICLRSCDETSFLISLFFLRVYVSVQCVLILNK